MLALRPETSQRIGVKAIEALVVRAEQLPQSAHFPTDQPPQRVYFFFALGGVGAARGGDGECAREWVGEGGEHLALVLAEQGAVATRAKQQPADMAAAVGLQRDADRKQGIVAGSDQAARSRVERVDLAPRGDSRLLDIVDGEQAVAEQDRAVAGSDSALGAVEHDGGEW